MVGPGCGDWEEINNWEVDIPESTSVMSPAPRTPASGEGESVKVVHLTDIHIDLTYTEVSPV